MTRAFHYMACGLDYVWLENGFTVRDGRHGPAVAIADAGGLHEAIAQAVIGAPDALRGQEVRFLRAQLKLSQAGLAGLLQTRRGSVARWEAEPDKAIPGTADAAVRLLYALKSEGRSAATDVVEVLAGMDGRRRLSLSRKASFQATRKGWRPRIAA